MVVLELEVGGLFADLDRHRVDVPSGGCSSDATTLRSDHHGYADGPVAPARPVPQGYFLDLAALGVTSRLPLQSLPTLTLLEADRPAVVAASEMSLGST